MKYFDPQTAQTSMACWGIHVGLTILLAICLVVYDGLQNTLPILIGYMFIGWIIPLAAWKYIQNIVNRPVGPERSNINSVMLSTILLVLGSLVLLLSLLLPSSLMDSIQINGEVVTKSDPRFATEILKFRVGMGCMGLLFALVGYYWLRFIRKK